jgi:hypothetical protein
MVGLLALAHERGCEAELAAALDAILDAGELPDLDTLRCRFAPPDSIVPTITVALPVAAVYDALLTWQQPRPPCDHDPEPRS